jgi:hypothetical protein
MRRIVVTALFGMGIMAATAAAAGAAQAQFVDSRTIPGQAVGELGNVVGGGIAEMIGGGDDRTIVYGMGGAGAGARPPVQAGRLARLSGGDGDGQQVEYLAPPPRSLGREAALVGGGDTGEVVYVPRAGQR